MIVVNNLFPVFFIIFTGYCLRRFNLINETFTRTSDRLIYFIFFPLLLFWKIGGAPATAALGWNLCLAAIIQVVLVYIVSSSIIRVLPVPDFKAGAFSQSCYRFNTYIGMAVILNVLGEEGVRQFGVLIGFVIPLINILAVSTLIWYSGKSPVIGERVMTKLKALVSNPLIIACIAGIGYSRLIGGFPVVLENTFALAGAVTLPLALLSIGSSLTFDTLRDNLSLSVVSSLFKLVLGPVIGYFLLRRFSVNGTAFLVGMIYFTLPTSTAIYVLSSQLNSDTQYASSAIMLSTLLSFFSLTLVLWWFTG